MELVYAGLHQLCAPLLDRLERIPAPQRQRFGGRVRAERRRCPGSVPGRLGHTQPVVGGVRGAAGAVRHRRRAMARSRLGVVSCIRRPSSAGRARGASVRRPRTGAGQLRHLPDLDVPGLRNGDARALLSSAVRFRLDEQVRDRIVAETRGNPLALLELPRGLSATELAGFGTATVSSLSGGIEESFRRRIAALPEETRRLLLIAAADPLGEPMIVWRAAAASGHQRGRGGACGRGGAVRVRHSRPVPSSARPRRRLRERGPRMSGGGRMRRSPTVTDAEADPDRRAWHRALASAGPDEAVADELERSAGSRAARAVGRPAAAAFLERSVGPDARVPRAAPSARWPPQRRGISPARRRTRCGSRRSPSAGPSTSFTARALRCCAVGWRRCSAAPRDAPPLLLGAARRLERFDRRVARDTYRDAFIAAIYAGRFAGEYGAARGRGGHPLGGAVDRAPERDRRAARRGRAAHRRRLGDGRGSGAARACRFLVPRRFRGSSTCTGSSSPAALAAVGLG